MYKKQLIAHTGVAPNDLVTSFNIAAFHCCPFTHITVCFSSTSYELNVTHWQARLYFSAVALEGPARSSTTARKYNHILPSMVI